MTGQPVQKLEIAQGVLQPAAHASQQDKAAVAQLQALADGVDHVGVVLFGGELNDIGVIGLMAQRVEVPHRQVRVDAVGHQGVEAPVGGDDVVPGDGVGAKAGSQGHGPHDVTDIESGVQNDHLRQRRNYCFHYIREAPF